MGLEALEMFKEVQHPNISTAEDNLPVEKLEGPTVIFNSQWFIHVDISMMCQEQWWRILVDHNHSNHLLPVGQQEATSISFVVAPERYQTTT